MNDSHDQRDNVFYSAYNKDCKQHKIKKKHFNRDWEFVSRGLPCIHTHRQDLEQIILTAAFADENANI